MAVIIAIVAILFIFWCIALLLEWISYTFTEEGRRRKQQELFLENLDVDLMHEKNRRVQENFVKNKQVFWSRELPDAERKILRLELQAKQTTDIEQQVELLYTAQELRKWCDKQKQVWSKPIATLYHSVEEFRRCRPK